VRSRPKRVEDRLLLPSYQRERERKREKEREREREAYSRGYHEKVGTQFTCFTGWQVLSLQGHIAEDAQISVHPGTC